jgi:DNA-nicking Smr family endonuclease
MRKRRDRALSEEEIAVWAHVARSVKAFSGRTIPELAPTAFPIGRGRTAETGGAVRTAPVPAPKPALAPLVPLERRTLQALRRGRQGPEAVIDLHGLRQDEAHDRLRAFLFREQGKGARLVLVITGKGAAGTTFGGDERGVLKRVVPHWLRLPDLRPIVLGFEDAALNHGGTGALYVRLRRPKDGAA